MQRMQGFWQEAQLQNASAAARQVRHDRTHAATLIQRAWRAAHTAFCETHSSAMQGIVTQHDFAFNSNQRLTLGDLESNWAMLDEAALEPSMACIHGTTRGAMLMKHVEARAQLGGS